jgi:catechol 2,3-dioxygenase-like lactoylglutathione lyase family enzyme
MPSYWYDHVHLISPDPVKTAEFYEKMFDARRVSVSELEAGRVMVELDLNGSRVLVMSRRVQPETAPSSPETDYGLEHFGIRTDNLEAAVADLKAKGVQFKEEIREIRPGVKISFLWAPENVLVELLEISS